MARTMNIDPKATTVSLAVVAAIVATIWVTAVQWNGLENNVERAHTRIDTGITRMAQIEMTDEEMGEDLEGIEDEIEDNTRALLLLKDQVRGLANDIDDQAQVQDAANQAILNAIEALDRPVEPNYGPPQ